MPQTIGGFRLRPGGRRQLGSVVMGPPLWLLLLLCTGLWAAFPGLRLADLG